MLGQKLVGRGNQCRGTLWRWPLVFIISVKQERASLWQIAKSAHSIGNHPETIQPTLMGQNLQNPDSNIRERGCSALRSSEILHYLKPFLVKFRPATRQTAFSTLANEAGGICVTCIYYQLYENIIEQIRQ